MLNLKNTYYNQNYKKNKLFIIYVVMTFNNYNKIFYYNIIIVMYYYLINIKIKNYC